MESPKWQLLGKLDCSQVCLKVSNVQLFFFSNRCGKFCGVPWLNGIYCTGATVSTSCTYSTLNPRRTPTRTPKLATSSITSTHAHSNKQTVKLTYSLSYLRLVNKHWEAVKAGKLSKPETTVRLMNWAASQHNISSSLGLKQTTQLLIGRAAWSRCEECTLPTSTVASQRLDRQQQDRLSVIEALHRYVTVWPSAGLHWVTV